MGRPIKGKAFTQVIKSRPGKLPCNPRRFLQRHQRLLAPIPSPEETVTGTFHVIIHIQYFQRHRAVEGIRITAARTKTGRVLRTNQRFLPFKLLVLIQIIVEAKYVQRLLEPRIHCRFRRVAPSRYRTAQIVFLHNIDQPCGHCASIGDVLFVNLIADAP